ncbi:hypothetical protein [Acetobacterium sp.]|uniref:hypothetical protein n=1 Tax=Acetobacterium sp. TaxID=1872094 RepID=UPI003593A070
MIELINEKVTHKTFGVGKITCLNNRYITIQFDKAAKEFIYPDAFKILLLLDDSFLMEKINEILKTKENFQDKEVKIRQIEKPLKKPVQKTKNMNHTDLDGVEHMKIGEIARTILRKRLENGHVEPDEIELMQTKYYSRETFHIQYPLLLRTKNPSGDKPVRYYAKPLKIWGHYYYLCSEWYEVPANNDRPFLMKWLILHK